MILFYRLARAGDAPLSAAPPDLSVRSWCPEEGPPPRSPFWRENMIWWGIHAAGLFSRGGFVEVAIWDGNAMLHRLVVTPRWYRFPFMAREDLQIGGLWTSPATRGRGLARIGVREAVRRAGGGCAIWYVTDAGNRASGALAEACGFRLAAVGERSRPLGLRALGRFRITAEIP